MWYEKTVRGWTETELNELKNMWNKGKTIREIAEKLKRTPNSVKMCMYRHKEMLNLINKHKGGRPRKQDKPVSKFEKQYYGSVPYLHWTITKSWGKAQ